jgi:hypothetical protein
MKPSNLEAIEREMAETIKAKLLAAYEAGWADARSAILSAASLRAPLNALEYAAATEGGRSKDKRAPRGLLTAVLVRALGDHPGSTAQELESRLPAYDSRVSPKSVGNELRRGESLGRYVREGALWYLPSYKAGHGQIDGLSGNVS